MKDAKLSSSTFHSLDIFLVIVISSMEVIKKERKNQECFIMGKN